MSRWLREDATPGAKYLREWISTPKGQAYRKKKAEYARAWRKAHPERFRTTQKRAYDKVRLECLQHYSKPIPECACCEEKQILFLHLDHINGDGAQHRRQMTKDQGYVSGGNNLPYWLKKHNYPPGFQVLCANCNLGKRCNAVCPHQLQ